MQKRNNNICQESFRNNLVYLFFSSSSFLNFSAAFFFPFDTTLGLRDLGRGDNEVLLLLCLLYLLGVGDRLLRRLEAGERLLRRRGEPERLLRLSSEELFLEDIAKS